MFMCIDKPQVQGTLYELIWPEPEMVSDMTWIIDYLYIKTAQSPIHDGITIEGHLCSWIIKDRSMT